MKNCTVVSAPDSAAILKRFLSGFLVNAIPPIAPPNIGDLKVSLQLFPNSYGI